MKYNSVSIILTNECTRLLLDSQQYF